MLDNKNLILASIAIIAVVLVALILFFPKDGKNEVNKNLDSVKVYIHHEKTDDKDGYYSLCSISTENLVKVRNEYEKTEKFTNEDVVNGKQINGDYKVVVDDKYVAFDKENKSYIYVSEYNSLFKFESNIYDLVIEACES